MLAVKEVTSFSDLTQFKENYSIILAYTNYYSEDQYKYSLWLIYVHFSHAVFWGMISKVKHHKKLKDQETAGVQ